MEPLLRNRRGTSKPMSVLTKQQRIARLAKQSPQMGFTSLNHYLDEEWMKEAFKSIRKKSSPGSDGVTVEEYGRDLEDNIADLLERAKSGRYFAPPVKRKRIPKGNGKETRPIGMPTTEDKVLQRAVTMVLEPIYEQDFLECSKGFRPGRSAHQALKDLWGQIMGMGGGWVLDVDLEDFYNTLVHPHLRELIRQRVRDGVILRLIGKWLKAGVLEGSRVWYPKEGTPQGGVISPLLSNVYLHYVLDLWFEHEVRPTLRGQARMIRYADDFVMVFKSKREALRVKEMMIKRLAQYGLKVHPVKTQVVRFIPEGDGRPRSGTFDFLGFTHYWGKSRKGRWMVKRKTAKDRLARSIRAIRQWCRDNRHQGLRVQRAALSRKVRGHYGYYGITGNYSQLKRYYEQVKRSWRYWLNRRQRVGDMPWSRFNLLLEHFPLPQPRVVHSIYAAKP
jgi:group II intron reverse transcriptase/maturase